MLKIVIASLFSNNKKYATPSKICGSSGSKYDGMLFHP